MTMRRLHLGVLASVVPALLLSLALVGCGGKEDKGTTDGGKPAADSGKKSGTSGGALKAIERGKGTLVGKVELVGAKPDLKALNEALLKQINEKKDDKDHCLSPKAPQDEKDEQSWRIGDNNGVGNVFVWIGPPSRNEYFKIDEAQRKEVPKEVTMDQPFCAFVPHCVVLFPKYTEVKGAKKSQAETGQKFIVKNSATISHNTKMDGGADNPGGNETLPPGKPFNPQMFTPSPEPIVIRCNIHPWMNAYARAFDHPYATLTSVGGDPKAGKSDPKDTKYGTYEIKNVPAGKVKVFAWHEKAGYLNANGAKGEEIDLTDGKKEQNFKLTAPK
jgi:hypothetical protein